jgi:hypothetical protein
MGLKFEMCRGSLLTAVQDDTSPTMQYRPSADDWGVNNDTMFIDSTLQYAQSLFMFANQLTFYLTVSRRIQMRRSHWTS